MAPIAGPGALTLTVTWLASSVDGYYTLVAKLLDNGQLVMGAVDVA